MMIELAKTDTTLDEEEFESLVGNSNSNNNNDSGESKPQRAPPISKGTAKDLLAAVHLNSKWAGAAVLIVVAILFMVTIGGGPSSSSSSSDSNNGSLGDSDNSAASNPTIGGDMSKQSFGVPGKDGLAKDGGPVLYQYARRGIPLDDTEKAQLAEEWGSWTVADPKASQRPNIPFEEYPNRDIPWDDIEIIPNAWQTDQGYLSKFLPEAKALVMRAMEAHLAEYGFSKSDLPGDDFETRRDKSPFLLEIVSDDERRRRKLSTGVNEFSGWSTPKSYDGLVKRLLHAVVSQDTFNLVLGGHSSAAGHGNHFQQSYALQFQRVMEPVFARLGVKHFSRNTGMGGLGTIQSAMGAADIYGRDVDILIWDSSMTEKDAADIDLFARQGLLGSDRAPMLWAGKDDHELYPTLQQHADVDYMMYGTGLGPLPVLMDPTKINEIPWAAHYLKCDDDWTNLCKENRYNGTCWIARPDHFEPPTPQKPEPGGRASWHEGNREHQIYGRTLSFTVLRALYSAIELWEKQPDYKLSDDMWHVTDYYQNIKSKILNLDSSIGACYEIEDKLPTEFCTVPFQARTEFSPRAYPAYTSLRSIMKPSGSDESVPDPGENIYDPPDVYNPVLGVPKGEVDYLAIVENGNDYLPFVAPAPPLGDNIGPSTNTLLALDKDDNGEAITPGLGWGVNAKVSADLCNGTYDSFCGRSEDHECLLYGHNDHRGGMTFDSLSGWGIFTLRNLKHGMIFFKMDSWRKAEHNPVTEGWAEENGGGRRLNQAPPVRHSNSDELHLQEPEYEIISDRDNERNLKKEDQNFCKDFTLEFAINGNITRLNADEILGARHSLVQRVVQIWTVQNDPGLTNGETIDVEVGVRLRGCQRQHVFWVTHIYWA